MMKGHLPEEKLLRLIREKPENKAKPVDQKNVIKPVKKDSKNLFGFLNGVLILILAGLMALLAYSTVDKPQSQGDRWVKDDEPAPPAAQDPVLVQKEIKPFAHYQGQLETRDLFERPLTQVAANASVDLTKRYKLVGIVLGDVPEAIVEDLTSRTTVFIRPGDRLESVQVKTIEEGRVVFLQEGLEIELKQ